MRLAVSWWSPSAGGSTQAVRGNVRAFQQAGHDVDLWYAEQRDALEARVRAGEYDAVFIPYIHYTGDWSAFADGDTHVHLQLGGYPAEDHPQLTRQAITSADTVSALDSSIIAHFQQYWKLDPRTIALIPNPPNRALFDRQPGRGIGTNTDTDTGTGTDTDAATAADADTAPSVPVTTAAENVSLQARAPGPAHALVPKLGSAQKRAAECHGVVTAASETQFRVLYTGDSHSPPRLPPNAQYYPSVPLTAMPRQYRAARVVINPAHKDVLPNTAFEAWLSGRPYVCHTDAIGHLQSVPAGRLDPDHWGRSVAWWHGAMDDGDVIGGGNGVHYHAASEPGDIGSLVTTLMTDRQRWAATVDAAQAWLDAWGDWDWQAKGEALSAVIAHGGPLPADADADASLTPVSREDSPSAST